jgi:DNA-binding NarL/FixJ family response regulator
VSAPYLVIDDGAGAEAAVDQAARLLESDGWRLVDGLDARPALARVVLRGTVASPRDAAAALLSALDGFGLLVRAMADDEVVDRLVDDLHRLGPVDHRAASAAASAGARMTVEGRAILGLLAEGHTLGEAATRLGLSRRTADRRLAEARVALGVTRTTEAISRASRLGWLSGPPR